MQASNETQAEQLQLHFWAIGDLHYRAIEPWQRAHMQRIGRMFTDLHALWGTAGRPTFCASPGDLVETATLKNYQLAKAALIPNLGNIPFYPGVGNHEYFGPDGELPAHMAETFTSVWQKPLRYSWTTGAVTGIMLDYPDPYTLADPEHVYISQETLEFLDRKLSENPYGPAVIFLHCPLHNTVLERNVERHSDYNSLQNFFAPENSDDVRAILAKHAHACLFFSGHTHSGWEAPGIVKTEDLGSHPVTFVNLMSPWYTGTKTGPRLNKDHDKLEYIADTPDVIPSFSIRIYERTAKIRVRDHQSKSWLKEWIVPIIPT